MRANKIVMSPERCPFESGDGLGGSFLCVPIPIGPVANQTTANHPKE